MAKTMKKLVSLILVVCMALGLMGTVAFAAGESTTVWLGAEDTITVEKSDDGYSHELFITDDGARRYYETSNHALVITGGGAVHTYVLVDTLTTDGEFTPSGIYEHGVSNYEVVYGCLVASQTRYNDTRYKRVNPEDSIYFTAAQAEQLRAILSHAYPYLSVEEAKAWLKEAGFEYADELDRSELLSATQSAIWAAANPDSSDSFLYNTTATTARKNTWGGYLHDFSSEITNFADSTKSAKYKQYAEIGNRINALRDFLLNLDPVEAEAIVISDLEIVESVPVMAKEGVYTVALQVELNDSGSSALDNIIITVYVDGEEAAVVAVEPGTEVYDLTVEAQAGQTIEAVVSGTQFLPEDVYFYEPKGGTNVSQCMVGVAAGETAVYSQAELTLEVEEVPTCDLLVKKTSTEGKALSNAAFELMAVGQEATISVGSFVVGEEGVLLEGLLPGTYELKETAAPEGYEKLEASIAIVITEDGEAEIERSRLVKYKDGVLTIKNELVEKPVVPEVPDETVIEDENVPLSPIPSLFSKDHFAYIVGREDGLVYPEAYITRAEVATIFFRLLDEDVRNAEMTTENQFTDVSEDAWYNTAVSTLASMGILLGKGDGSYFAPDEYITRAEFAAIAARFDPTGSAEGQLFTDIAGHWAEQEIMIAANNGWVKGENGKFRPDDNITRAEAVTLINRVLHRLPETKADLLSNMVIWADNMDENAWYYLAIQEATNSHDYQQKGNTEYETWTAFREPYDWSKLEK